VVEGKLRSRRARDDRPFDGIAVVFYLLWAYRALRALLRWRRG